MDLTRKFKIPGAGTFRATGWTAPYQGGRPAFPRAGGMHPGVYLIMSATTGKIHYVGSAQFSIYDTVYRHFQTWNDRQPHQHATYSKTGPWRIMVIRTADGAKALALEDRLIKKFNPVDNDLQKAGDSSFDVFSGSVDDWVPPF